VIRVCQVSIKIVCFSWAQLFGLLLRLHVKRSARFGRAHATGPPRSAPLATLPRQCHPHCRAGSRAPTNGGAEEPAMVVVFVDALPRVLIVVGAKAGHLAAQGAGRPLWVQIHGGAPRLDPALAVRKGQGRERGTSQGRGQRAVLRQRNAACQLVWYNACGCQRSSRGPAGTVHPTAEGTAWLSCNGLGAAGLGVQRAHTRRKGEGAAPAG
jgi:hypothetical protein